MITSEASTQSALFKWATLQSGKYPELKLMYHPPNGGKRDVVEAANLKRQGVKAGVPDICLPVSRGGYHGLYIELKTNDGRLTVLQKEWLEALAKQGNYTAVCRGFEQAKNLILGYLKGEL